MNRNQYDALFSNTPGESSVITINNLTDRTPRTLMYGYTFERHDFHVYLDKDGAIHILVYTSAQDDPETGAERVLVLDHAGPGGREITSNREFLPPKRACPELCDFEFCRLLLSFDLNPSFTTFSDRTAEGAEATTARPENLLKGVQLDDSLRKHPLYVERAGNDSTLSCRLLVQAAQNLGVPADTYGGRSVVAEYGADAVLAKATEYLEGIVHTDVQSSRFTSEVIAAAFGYGQYLQGDKPDLVNGRVVFRVDAEGRQFQKSTKLKQYEGTSFEGAQAVIGKIDGMPFIAAQVNDNTVHFEVQQFGDGERLCAQWMRMFNLKPTSKKKATKAAATA